MTIYEDGLHRGAVWRNIEECADYTIVGTAEYSTHKPTVDSPDRVVIYRGYDRLGFVQHFVMELSEFHQCFQLRFAQGTRAIVGNVFDPRYRESLSHKRVTIIAMGDVGYAEVRSDDGVDGILDLDRIIPVPQTS